MGPAFYFDRLYPLMDEVLRLLNRQETGFYLTGGTAASRGYLHHRFSDDLDLFVNDERRFELWADRLVQALRTRGTWGIEVLLREQRFVRCSIADGGVSLKVELVNDVPARVGPVLEHELLGRLDSPENIVANKLTALVDRNEPKDLADIWGFCCRLGIPLSPSIEGAQGKAAGIFPADLARILCSANRSDWDLIRWITAPLPERFLADLHQLGESLIL